jgi:hypothetical protein
MSLTGKMGLRKDWAREGLLRFGRKRDQMAKRVLHSLPLFKKLVLISELEF